MDDHSIAQTIPVDGVASSSARGTVILVYHRIVPHSEWIPAGNKSMFYTEDQLRRHLEHIGNQYTVITMDEFTSGDTPENSLVITFDDGCNTDLLALRVLTEFGMPAIFYIPSHSRDRAVSAAEQATISELLGGARSKTSDPGIEFHQRMAWGTLREFARESLVTIGAHSHQHARLKTFDSNAAMKEDLEKNLSLLQQELGLRPRHFAYPFGSCNARVEGVVSGLGFATAVTTGPGWNVAGVNHHRLRRCRPEYMFSRGNSYAAMGGGKGPDPVCTICGRAQFVERNPSNSSKVRCANCRSLPRHRNVVAIIGALSMKLPENARLLQFSYDSCWRGVPFKNVTLSGYSENRGTELNGQVQQRHGHRVRRVAYDATDIDCPDESYDIIIACQVLSSIEDDVIAFNEIMRVLAPTGIFLFTVPYIEHLDETRRSTNFATTANRREYGRDIAARFCRGKNYAVMTVAGFDLVEFGGNEAFLATHSPERAAELAEVLISTGAFAVSLRQPVPGSSASARLADLARGGE